MKVDGVRGERREANKKTITHHQSINHLLLGNKNVMYQKQLAVTLVAFIFVQYICTN